MEGEEAMDSDRKTREMVRERYGRIAKGSRLPAAASSCCSTGGTSVAEEGYARLEGYAPEADLSLGCGVPTAFASLRPGEVVVDLGSGAGNDAFIAARAVGAEGRVIGVDMTPEMISRARANAEKLGARNVEFRLGEIEALPVGDAEADVVISNCVLNLVPDKRRAFSEIHRILRPGGRFTVSDIVVDGDLPEAVRKSAEMWAGCVAGAIRKEEYLSIAAQTGFEVRVEKERPIEIPEEAVAAVLGGTPLSEPVRILSITVQGRRAAS
jgi:arsenite methyltransferase